MKIVKLVAIFCVLAGGIFLALSIGSLIKTTTSDDSSSKRIADLEDNCKRWEKKYRELRDSVDNANKSPKLEEEAKARAEAEAAKKEAEAAKARARAKLNAEAEAAEARAKAAEAEAARAQAKAEAARAEAAKARAVADSKAARAQAKKEEVRKQILDLVNKKDINGCRALWDKEENKKFLTQNEKFAIEVVLDYRPKAPEGKKFDNLIVIKKEVEKYLKTVGPFKDYKSLIVARYEIFEIENKHLVEK